MNNLENYLGEFGNFYMLCLFLSIIPILFLKKIAPKKLWLGLLLSIIFCPFGHFYIKGGFNYFILILLFGYILNIYIPDIVLLEILTIFLSATIMIARFKVDFLRIAEIDS